MLQLLYTGKDVIKTPHSAFNIELKCQCFPIVFLLLFNFLMLMYIFINNNKKPSQNHSSSFLREEFIPSFALFTYIMTCNFLN